jgi:urease accessory protein
MILIHRMISPEARQPNRVPVSAERRMFLKRRWRGVAGDGTEFGFDLESRLCDGALIHQNGNLDYVIQQEPERVCEIDFKSPQQAALIGWKIGNLHFPVQVLTESIRVENDPAIQQLCIREDWTYQEISVVFQPLTVAAHAS